MSCPSRHSAGTGKHYTMLENKTDSLRWKYPYTFTERVPLQYECIEARDSLYLYSPQCLVTSSMYILNVPFGCSQLGTKKMPVPKTGHRALLLQVTSKPTNSLRNPDTCLWACLHPCAIQSNNQGSLTSKEHGARCLPLVEEASWTEVSVQEVLVWQVWHTESWHLRMSMAHVNESCTYVWVMAHVNRCTMTRSDAICTMMSMHWQHPTRLEWHTLISMQCPGSAHSKSSKRTHPGPKHQKSTHNCDPTRTHTKAQKSFYSSRYSVQGTKYTVGRALHTQSWGNAVQAAQMQPRKNTLQDEGPCEDGGFGEF